MIKLLRKSVVLSFIFSFFIFSLFGLKVEKVTDEAQFPVLQEIFVKGFENVQDPFQGSWNAVASLFREDPNYWIFSAEEDGKVVGFFNSWKMWGW